MKEMFAQFSEAKIFSKLDVAIAYWHVELAPETRPLTAFLTKDGLFQWNRLTMGLKDSASAFQKVMTQILAGIENIFIYKDDILICAKTDEEEHDRILREVLTRLHDNNIRLNLRKLLIEKNDVPFLGHLISSEGIKPDPKNVKDLLDASEPTSVLGMNE